MTVVKRNTIYHTKMNFNASMFLLIIWTILCFVSCGKPEKDIKKQPNNEKTEIKKVKIILETSGSMEGFFNGDELKQQITNLISELDRISKSVENDLSLKELDFYTIDDKVKLRHYADDALSFNSKILNKNLSFVKSSPIDDIINYLVDSSKNKEVSIIVSDFVIDKIGKNPLPTIQSTFNLIFNKAKSKDIGVIIYRFLGNFNGTVHPAIGNSFQTSGVKRPYFIWMIGKSIVLKKLARKLSASPVFKPENQISFGIKYLAPTFGVFHQSNRAGTWKFKNGYFSKCLPRNNQFKFTMGLKFDDFPVTQFEDLQFLQNNIVLNSPTVDIKSIHFYSPNTFRKLIHPKESEMLAEYSHILEVNIGGIKDDDNKLQIFLKKSAYKWPFEYSTNNDSYLTNANNLNTFALQQIIEGIANAYGDLDNHTTKLFQINLKLEK